MAYRAVSEPFAAQAERGEGQLPDVNDVVDVFGDGLNMVVDEVRVLVRGVGCGVEGTPQ